MAWRTIAILLLSVTAAMPAMAQVHRCLQPNGRTTFSDAPCPANAVKAERLMGRDATTSEWVPDGYRRQEQIDSANRAAAIKRAHVHGDAPPQWEQGDGRGGAVILGDPGGGQGQASREQFYRDAQRRTSMGRLPAEQRARAEDFERSRGARGYQPAPGSQDDVSRPASRPPGVMTNCDSAGCWDSNGMRYNNAAGGNFTRSDGKFCTRAGTNVICN